MKILFHTDFGNDPDDAVALAYLIENGVRPDILGLTPGHIQQNCSLSGFVNKYRRNINCDHWFPKFYQSKDVLWNNSFNTGKHRTFDDETLFIHEEFEEITVEKALITGPPKNIGDKLVCHEMFFQGGYSPNSIKTLEKFEGKKAVPSFNPNGAKDDFNKLVDSLTIGKKYFIGKNVCHGFTLEDVLQFWAPIAFHTTMFINKLKWSKKMHDVLAAILFLDKDLGVWEQAKPVWHGGKLSTEQTNLPIYSLIGLNF